MKTLQMNAILQGYTRFLGSCLRVMLFTFVVTAAASLISFPLWYWATNSRASFNVFVLFVLVLITVLLMLRNIRAKMQTTLSGGGSIFKTAVLEPLVNIGRFLVTLVLISAVVYLFASSRFLLALIGAVLSLLIIGVFYFQGRPR